MEGWGGTLKISKSIVIFLADIVLLVRAGGGEGGGRGGGAKSFVPGFVFLCVGTKELATIELLGGGP